LLNMETVPVLLADDMSEQLTKAFRLSVNKASEFAEWDMELFDLACKYLLDDDYELSKIGFDDVDLAGITDRLGIGDGSDASNQSNGGSDAIPEPPANPVTRPGDLWVMGDHRLLCGDSTKAEDVIRLMKGERAILFATDPPYLVDYDGTNHPPNKRDKEKAAKAGKDVAPLAGNKDWSESYGISWDDSNQGSELYEGFIRIAIDHAIDPHAAWYTWHASRRQAMLEEVWTKAGAFVHQQIIWNKNASVLTRCTYLWKHEPCLYGWIRGNKPPKAKDAPNQSTVWDINSLAGNERPDHPTPKPLDCFAHPMHQHVEPGGLCYEPFSGSGSQIMAGHMTHRRVYAMEISPTYCDVTLKRFIQGTGKICYLEGSVGKTFEMVAAERGIDLAG
ncbi:MAG: DNA methylase, partial [Magnetococcus sp. YQC-5]